MIHAFIENTVCATGLSQFKEGIAEVLGKPLVIPLARPGIRPGSVAGRLNEGTGMIIAYEKNGYDTTQKAVCPASSIAVPSRIWLK